MAPAFPSRKAAEQLDALLAGAPVRRVPDDVAELVPVVRALQAVPRVEPRPEFAVALRERLMVEADRVLAAAARTSPGAPEPDPVRRTRARDRRVAALVGSVALAGATGSMAMAAQSALPGDALYPVKRGVESLRSALPAQAGTRGEWLLGDATERLDEVSGLALRGSADDLERVGPTLDAFTTASEDGADDLLEGYRETGDEELVATLHRFAARSLATLERLEPAIPSNARDELVEAASTLERIDARAAGACPSCDPGTLPSVASLAAVSDPATAETPAPPGDDRGPEAPADDVAVPDVDPDELPPGSVNPGSGTGDGTGALDPVRELADELVGDPDPGSTSPSSPDLGGVLRETRQDLEDAVGDTTDELTDPLDETLEDPLGDLG